MARRRVIVVGGANTDIGGAPSRPLVRHDSNPGRVTIRHGGVGRNIACDLARLGLEVSFITAVGEDLLSAGVLESCMSCGVDVSLSRTVPGARGSVYLYVTDGRGEMDAAIADMDIVSALTPDYLRPLLGELNAAERRCMPIRSPGRRRCTFPRCLAALRRSSPTWSRRVR